MKLLLDSVILIDHFNGVPSATRYLRDAAHEAAISVITRAEVMTGSKGKGLATAGRFLDAFPTLEIDRAVADAAAALRRTHRWKLPDAFQAALARRHGLKLVTRNRRDFPPARHRFVHIPYEL